MASLGWIKYQISREWEESLPDRFDPQRAAQEADEDGMIGNFENSYSMHHKVVEATREEVLELMARYDRAEAGLIRWDEERQELYQVDE